jgi:hypothetical protein
MRSLFGVVPLAVARGLAIAHAQVNNLQDQDGVDQHVLRNSIATSGYPNEPLQCFEVTNPVLSSDGIFDGNETLGSYPGKVPPESCQAQLMYHVFANSYGHPYVGMCGTFTGTLFLFCICWIQKDGAYTDLP